MTVLLLAAAALARPIDLAPMLTDGVKLQITEDSTQTADLGGGAAIVTHVTTVTERDIVQGGRLFADEVSWIEHVRSVSIEKQTAAGTKAWSSDSSAVADAEFWELARVVHATYKVTVAPDGGVTLLPFGVDTDVLAARQRAVEASVASLPKARLDVGAFESRQGPVTDAVPSPLVVERTWTLVHVDDEVAQLSESVALVSPPDPKGGVWTVGGRGELTWDLALGYPVRSLSQHKLEMRVHGQRRPVELVETTTVEVIEVPLLSGGEDPDPARRSAISGSAAAAGAAQRTGKSRRPD